MPFRRIFVAIDIPEDVRGVIVNHISYLNKAFPHARVKWERAEKFHITMKFFGDADEPLMEKIEELVATAAASVAPFKLTAQGPGSFRRRESAVLWIGVEEFARAVGTLARIAKCLKDDDQQTRRFHPHITIARIKKPVPARELIDAHDRAALQPREFLVDHLTIYESKLLQTGSVYSVVSRHRLSE